MALALNTSLSINRIGIGVRVMYCICRRTAYMHIKHSSKQIGKNWAISHDMRSLQNGRNIRNKIIRISTLEKQIYIWNDERIIESILHTIAQSCMEHDYSGIGLTNVCMFTFSRRFHLRRWKCTSWNVPLHSRIFESSKRRVCHVHFHPVTNGKIHSIGTWQS